MNLRLFLFSTCPTHAASSDSVAYLEKVVAVARWSEHHGCTGILVYSDNSLLDAWMIAHVIIQSTTNLCPLVAVQPVYMHPYTVAKLISSFAYLHRRRIYLNMVAGGFSNDLAALNDTTPHDARYDRLVEYTTIIKQLLSGSPVTYEGRFYRIRGLRLAPPFPQDLCPGIFVSGSSEAGLAAAETIGATAIEYPRPPTDYAGAPRRSIDAGIRVGIIARQSEDEAWGIARERFPEDRKGQLTHQLAMKVSDSIWHRQLSDLGTTTDNGPYWLAPFQNYKTFCPYLVGSYQRVAQELARYISAGFNTFVLDIPPNERELYHTRLAFKEALMEVSG